MSTLIFQIHIKQWDKGQRSDADVAARAAQPDRYSIVNKPGYFILNKACIVDQHGDDVATNVYPNGRIKTVLMADGSVKIDRFMISGNDDVVVLSYREKDKQPIRVAELNQGWVQAHYHWRYTVEEGGQFYWLYETLTFNAACIAEYDADYFLHSSPRLIFDAPD
jgi:hypothetical protein